MLPQLVIKCRASLCHGDEVPTRKLQHLLLMGSANIVAALGRQGKQLVYLVLATGLVTEISCLLNASAIH